MIHIAELHSPVLGAPFSTPSETELNSRLNNCMLPICDQSQLNESGLVPLLYPSNCGDTFHNKNGQLSSSIVPSSPSLEAVLRSCEDPTFANTVMEKLLSGSKQQIPSSDASVPKSCVKCEKTDQTALNGYQHSMTLALSQLSDADLISMINPSAFDSGMYPLSRTLI